MSDSCAPSTFDGRRFPFRSCGERVLIYGWVRLLGAEAMTVGHDVIIDDFVFIDGRAGMKIGSHVHIAGYASIIGQGRCTIADYATLSTGARLITGTDVPDGSGMLNSTIPDDLRAVMRGEITIGRHAMVSTNAVILPNITIGEGAIVAAGAVVRADVPPWTKVAGVPARPIGTRPAEIVLRNAAELERRTGPTEP